MCVNEAPNLVKKAIEAYVCKWGTELVKNRDIEAYVCQWGTELVKNRGEVPNSLKIGVMVFFAKFAQ